MSSRLEQPWNNTESWKGSEHRPPSRSTGRYPPEHVLACRGDGAVYAVGSSKRPLQIDESCVPSPRPRGASPPARSRSAGISRSIETTRTSRSSRWTRGREPGRRPALRRADTTADAGATAMPPVRAPGPDGDRRSPRLRLDGERDSDRRDRQRVDVPPAAPRHRVPEPPPFPFERLEPAPHLVLRASTHTAAPRERQPVAGVEREARRGRAGAPQRRLGPQRQQTSERRACRRRRWPARLGRLRQTPALLAASVVRSLLPTIYSVPATIIAAMFSPASGRPSDGAAATRRPSLASPVAWQVFGKSRVKRCVPYLTHLGRRLARKSKHLASLTPGRRFFFARAALPRAVRRTRSPSIGRQGARGGAGCRLRQSPRPGGRRGWDGCR